MTLCSKTMITLALAVASLMASAEEGVMEFSYDNSGQWGYWGTAKLENYDLAIRIANPSFVGKQITSISLPIREDAGAKDYKIWLSTELALVKQGSVKVPNPNVMSVDVTPSNGQIAITLDSPYTITEEGIYVGCSFSLPKLTKAAEAPCRLSVGSYADGMYVHTTRSFLKFMALGDEYNAAVPFSVMIKGNYPATSVAIGELKEVYGELGQSIAADVKVLNLGTEPVASVGYSYAIGDETGKGHLDINQPLQPNFTRMNPLRLPLVTTKPEGNYGFTIRIDSVNGAANQYVTPEASSQIILRGTVPVHRAVIEEYTGLWCGYCPKGFVALEKMNKLYPDKFIGLSYHNGDQMEIMESKYFPVNVVGYPEAWIDRTEKIDPYFGRDKNVFGLDKVWEEYCDIFPIAAINVSAQWNEDKRHIEVDSHLRFVKDINSEDDAYRLCYYLVGNGLEDPSWMQCNNYTNNGSYYMDTDMDIFTNGGSLVSGLVYNDIVIENEGTKGLPHSLEAHYAANEDIYHHYTFDTDKALCTITGENLLSYAKTLDVVVLLLETSTGKIVNADKTSVGDDFSAIHSLHHSEAGSSRHYSLDGRPVSALQPGIHIVRYGDGTAKTVVVP